MKRILGFAILGVMCLTACGVLGGKKDELTDVSEVKRAYLKSPDEARKKYDGKELTVLGTVMFRSPVNPSLTLGTGTDAELLTVPNIDCQFDKSDVLFKGVKNNDIIKIKGTLKFTASGMEMNPCKFVPF
jgi:hypothetical protein